MSRRAPWRSLLRLAVVVGIAGAVMAVLVGSDRPAPAQAADLSRFNAGDIISDAFFFNGNAMGLGDVQNFLDLKGASCTTGYDGAPCLHVYRQDTPTVPGDEMCGTYQGVPQETAASIIVRVGIVCGISQKALLVMLQKEEGLVTISRPSWVRYQSAMGMGCPDTAGCDSQYAWFFQQVYGAAHQFKRYAVYPGKYGYKAGMTNQIRWSPDVNCGSGPVFIYNQATAGLYNYTPYQPNAAALAAGYGTGDGCSAYGNRNFFSYFTDWFGSTHDAGAAAISDDYYRLGGPAVLGSPTMAPLCGMAGGGCGQLFDRGAIYWSPASGAHPVWGSILSTWTGNARETGPLGYPITDELIPGDGVGRYQWFQGGAIYWRSDLGAHMVRAGIRAAWDKTGRDGGPLGYPISDELAAADGVGRVQNFEHGSIYYSDATGAFPVRGAIAAAWNGLGGVTSWLGYPTTTELPGSSGVGTAQRFQRGVIAYTDGTGAQVVHGSVLAAWTRSGSDAGPLGYPTGAETTGPGGTGTVQPFEHGSIYYTATTDAHAVFGAIADGWTTRGGATGAFGFPTTDPRSLTGAAVGAQDFQNGNIYQVAAGGTVAVGPDLVGRYRAEGAEAGSLGLPSADATGDATYQVQTFARGTLYAPAGGPARVVRGAIGSTWSAGGGLSGPLGAPLTDETPAGAAVVQRFQGGSVYWSPATWSQVVQPDIAQAYEAVGGATGPLGLPVAAETTSGSVRVQRFQNGWIGWTSGSGAHAVRGAIGSTWSAGGGVSGPLGAPLTDEAAAGAGVVQRFEHGSIYWSAPTWSQVVSADIGQGYDAVGGAAGPLGLPVAAETASGGARVQRFQGGWIGWTSGSGAHAVRGAVGSAWSAGGGLSGPLGAPLTDETPAGAGVVQRFERGSIYWSAATWSQVVSAQIGPAYDASGGPAGPLGLPMAGETTSGTTRLQRFQGGWIGWTTANGGHVVRGAIGAAWSARGGITGPLGAPMTDEAPSGGGAVQQFEHGTIFWTAAEGIRITP